ncbi:MAG: hypothetical protein BAJATHORv1_60006 [Candidatus Thorarchaeota archaeon]|nr:MAG: hypothetical protein BAJATHORv1_60006 [Candidatus Thorarchaeota archaeon]
MIKNKFLNTVGYYPPDYKLIQEEVSRDGRFLSNQQYSSPD